MRMLKTALCLSVPAFILCMGSSNASAYDTSPDKHTYIHTPELESAPSYQVASITWLPDYDENEKIWGKYVIGGSGGHGKGDGCDSKYNLSSCPDHADCDYCSTNKSKVYFKACKKGYKADPEGSTNCVLDCTPNKCDETYNLTSKSDANAQYSECDTKCDGIVYRYDGCNPGYFEKNDKCVKCEKTQTEDSCPEGKTLNPDTVCENASGAEVGDCEDCLERKCANHFICSGEFDVPDGKVCECGGKKYYPICNYCDKPYLKGTCPNGKIEANECTKRDGKQYVDCLGCNAPGKKCDGLELCENGKEPYPEASRCECSNETYGQTCLVPEKCFYTYREDSECMPSGMRQEIIKGEYAGSVYCSKSHFIGKEVTKSSDSCQRGGYTWYENMNNCNASNGSCAEKIRCINDEGKGTPCECGGLKYFSECKESCLYEFREDSECAPSGMRQEVMTGEYAGSVYCSKSHFIGREVTKSSDSCQRGGYTWYKESNHCDATGGSCAEKIRCINDEGKGTPCECGGLKYFSECKASCLYEFREDSECVPSGMRQEVMTGEYAGNVYCSKSHFIGKEITKSSDTCQRDGYTWYEKMNSCDATGGSCAGKTHCAFPGGKICQCGGLLYGDNCLTECNHHETEASCKAEGKGFTLMCQTEDGQEFGECE